MLIEQLIHLKKDFAANFGCDHFRIMQEIKASAAINLLKHELYSLANVL